MGVKGLLQYISKSNNDPRIPVNIQPGSIFLIDGIALMINMLHKSRIRYANKKPNAFDEYCSFSYETFHHSVKKEVSLLSDDYKFYIVVYFDGKDVSPHSMTNSLNVFKEHTHKIRCKQRQDMMCNYNTIC